MLDVVIVGLGFDGIWLILEEDPFLEGRGGKGSRNLS